ncbi:hypothetical protein DSECCO2_424010 [anaerobic digester metagenome]
MLRIDLGEAKYFTVSQWSADFTAQFIEVFNFILRKRQALLKVVSGDIRNLLHRIRLVQDCKNILIKVMVQYLQHGIVRGVGSLHLNIFFNSEDACDSHVLGNLNSICTPWSHHFATRPNKKARYRPGFNIYCATKQPTQFLYIV